MYRLVTKIVAWWDLIWSICGLLVNVCSGFLLIVITLQHPGPGLIIQWVFYFACLYLSYLCCVAPRRLLRATNKTKGVSVCSLSCPCSLYKMGKHLNFAGLNLLLETTDPETAVGLCRLWLILQWIAFTISTLLTVILIVIVIQTEESINDPFLTGRRNRDYAFNLMFFVLWCTYLALRGFALYSVHQFRSTLEQTVITNRKMSTTPTQHQPDSAI